MSSGERESDGVGKGAGAPDSDLSAMIETFSAPGEIGQSVSENDKRRILRERARKLAQKPDTEFLDREYAEVIEFMLAHERYAIEVRHIREVYPLRELTRVPCTPSFILGIISVRGKVISVTDIKEFCNLPDGPRGKSSRVLILSDSEMELGIVADTVIGESKIPVDEIQANLPGLGGIPKEYVKGVTKDRLIIIDAHRFLSDNRIVVHQEVGE